MTLKHFIFNSLYYLPNILFFFLINDTPTYGFFFFLLSFKPLLFKMAFTIN